MDTTATIGFSRFGVVRTAPVERQAAAKERRNSPPPAKKPRVVNTGISLKAALNDVLDLRTLKVRS